MRGRLVPYLQRIISILFWPIRAIWRVLGLLGLRLRRLLAILLRPVVRFIGRLGLALRHLLTRFIWRPLLFVTSPLRWVYRRILRRPLFFLARLMGRLLLWLLRHSWRIVRLPLGLLHRWLQRRWHAGEPGRQRRRRELRSRVSITRARLYVFLHRQRPPRRALHAPIVPRSELPTPRRRTARWATTGLALGLVAVASLMTAQQAPQIDRAVAQNDYQLRSSKFAPVVTRTTPTELPPSPTATPNVTPTPWPTPDPLNSGGSVAFTLRQHGQSDIYALSIGQSQPVRLTHDPADDRDPAWSPDGKRLAFASHRDGNWEIYVLSLLDGELRRLTNDPAFDAGPSWSPDGEWLVFESYRQDNLDLYIISADGEQGPLRVTQHPAPDFSPVWAPGGRHIAFTSWRSGNRDLFVLSLDDAADAAARNITNTPGMQEDHAAFSPEGDALAYSENSTGIDLIYVQQLDDNVMPKGEAATRGQGRHPSWSPDGKALTYIHSRAGQTHLIASSLDAWSVAPQAFTANRQLDSANWSPRTLPQPLPDYLAAINQAADPALFTEVTHPVQEDGPPYLLIQLAVNAPAPYLSDQVDQSFSALRQQVVAEAGWDFLGALDNLYEMLDARPLPGQTDRTWNKAGRAFDYQSTYPLAINPEVEVVREDSDYQMYWRTFLRTAAQDGTEGEPLRDLPWDFRARYGAEPRYYDQGGKLKDAIPSGYYIDFTTLAADFGWARVPASDNWRTYFPGALYWHYENRQGLAWEQAMLELYTPEEILANFTR